MKKQLRYKVLSVLIWLAIPFLACSTEPIPGIGEVSKTIVEEFALDRNGTVEVINKYGKIHVHTWDNSKVKFEIKISVEADDSKRAEERLHQITVAFSGKDAHREALTQLGPDNKNESWWSSWWKGKKKNVKIQVDYTVYAPQSAHLELSNRYGNIFIPTMENDVDIHLKYGNLTMEDVSGKLHLHLDYGKSHVGNVGSLDLDLGYGSFDAINVSDANLQTKYSKIIISNGHNLTWDSKYDDITIGEARHFSNEGKYDNIKLGRVASASVDTKYSTINADEIGESFDFETGYGSITIRRLGRGFSNGEIDSRNTNINFENSGDIFYSLKLNKIDPNLSSHFVEEKSIKNNNSREIEGYIGSSKSGRISITAKYGSIKIY